MQAVSDFSRGKVSGNILRLAMPMVVAQLVNVLYNIVDRMYIGHMPEDSVNALTGVGLTFPDSADRHGVCEPVRHRRHAAVFDGPRRGAARGRRRAAQAARRPS